MSTGRIRKEWAEKIKERKEFLEKVVNFVEGLLRKKEGLTVKPAGSPHECRVKRASFEHFSFLLHSQNVFCVNTVKVWYHPSVDGIDIKRLRPVLEVSYHARPFRADKCTVYVFDDDPAWQSALLGFIERKNVPEIEESVEITVENLTP